MADIQVGLAIRLTRFRKNLSQKDVAARMGTSRTYFTKVESARIFPGIEQFVRIAEAMGVEAAELLIYAQQLQRETEIGHAK